jgi:long-subunit fatty acid transport protein
MNTTPRFIAALALAGAFASTTLSASESGPYIRLENGVNSISGANLKLGTLSALGLGSGGSESIKFKSSYIFGGAAGYRFNESFAAEVELDYARNSVDTVGGVSAQNLFDQGVSLKQTTLLGGGVYNHKLNDAVTLTAGAAAGAQFSSANIQGDYSQPNVFVTRPTSDTSFVAQLKTGVTFALAKNFTFDAGYKLRFVSSADIYELNITGGPTEKFTIDSRLNHVFSAGFTVSF